MSSNFNLVERFLARSLSSMPIIKRFVKSLYSRVTYLINRKPYQKKTNYNIKQINSSDAESFFGYYDKSPASREGYLLLLLSNTVNTQHRPSAEKGVDLVVLSPDTKEVIIKIPVAAYNWQQGCRVQWLSNELFIFNDFDIETDKYIAKVYSSVSGKEVRRFAFPVQDSYKTEYYLSLNYRRLMALRPDYGYRNLLPLEDHELANLDNDGIRKVDFQTGESNLLISLRDICRAFPVENYKEFKHKVNHILISPSGQKFIFMHRYLIDGRRFDRLLLWNMGSSELKLLSDYGMVSHCIWLTDNKILGFLRGPSHKDSYWIIDIDSGEFEPFLHGRLNKFGDGHPSVCGDWVVTDTYPNKSRMQKLILINWKTGKEHEIGEFFHGFEFAGESRCDLHPRLSSNGKKVYFDSVFSGKRQMYVLEL